MTTSSPPELHADVVGAGPLLTLIPPVGLGGWVWRGVAERLTDDYTVAMIDLPGFGSPSLPAGTPWTVERFTDAVADYIEPHWRGPVDVAGVSLGGAIALELARRGLANRALAVSPIGFWSRAEARYAVASLRVTQRLARLTRPVSRPLAGSAAARAALLAQVVGRPRGVPAEAAEVMAREVADAPFAATLPYTGAYRFTPSPGMSETVTVAWGTRDRLLPPRQAERARKALPDARHVRLLGAGHVPLWDVPSQLAALLTAGERTQP